MTKKELLVMLENVPENADIRYFHDGMLLPLSTVKELDEKTGWTGTVAFSGVIPAKYQNRFKA